jgi:MFS family permease
VQGYFFGKVVRRTGERALVIIGTFGMAASIAIVPLLNSSGLVYAWTFVLAVANSVFSPAATGLVSVYADSNEQGTVLGAAQAISALGRTVGPPFIGTVYDVSPVTSFVLAGGFMVVAGLAGLRLAPVTHHTTSGHEPIPPSVPLPEPPPVES